MSGDFWTDAMDAALAAAWARGVATKAIGNEIGVTKNAVIGRARRIGLPARPSPIKGTRPVALRPRPTARPVMRAPRAPRPVLSAPREKAVRAPAPPKPAVAVAPPIRVPSPHRCQWPEWGSNAFPDCMRDPAVPRAPRFCDAPVHHVPRVTADGQTALVPLPYCAAHAERAYRVPEASPKVKESR